MRRRHFLKAAGLTLTLPALESLGGEQDLADSNQIKRLLLMTDGYGFHTPNFYPKSTGEDYPSNDVIKAFDPLRDDITLLSNLKHLNGHHSMKLVASGSKQSAYFGDSVDQVAARHLSQRVPIESLLLSTRTTGSTGGSFRNKVPVAMMSDVEEIFDFLFTKGDVNARDRKLNHQQSVLDLCLGEAKALSRQISQSDQQRLDEYFNSIRETEQLVKKERDFLHAPDIDPGMSKEEFTAAGSDYGDGEDYFAYLRSQMKFIELAFKFDLTRVAYLWEHGRNHGATHHGNREGSINTLTKYATNTCNSIAQMLKNLKQTRMADGHTLLDETLFVWTAALGSAAKHTGVDTPAIIAGGNLPHHGRYVRFETLQPTPKLHYTMLQALGVPVDRFEEATSTLNI